MAVNNGTAIAPINEAVYLLSKYAPNELDGLRADCPAIASYLSPGCKLGPADAFVVERLKVCIVTCQQVSRLCRNGIRATEGRIKRQKRLAVAGGITATIGSASVLGALSTAYHLVAYCGGALSLIGSVTTLLAEHVGKLPKATMTLFDSYRELSTVRADNEILLKDLETHMQIGPDAKYETQIVDLVGQGNTLFRKAHEMFAALNMVSETLTDQDK
jgi:phenylpyruvate tautomerase PptA (4-oxalocrotonate tautomerase family)